MYCIFAVDQTKLLKALLITVSILFTAYNTTVFLLQYENIMVSFLLIKTTLITFWNICKFEKKFFCFFQFVTESNHCATTKRIVSVKRVNALSDMYYRGGDKDLELASMKRALIQSRKTARGTGGRKKRRTTTKTKRRRRKKESFCTNFPRVERWSSSYNVIWSFFHQVQPEPLRRTIKRRRRKRRKRRSWTIIQM